jgi:hypothetical protein
VNQQGNYRRHRQLGVGGANSWLPLHWRANLRSLLIAAAVLAPTTSLRAQQIDAVAGCYNVETGRWTGPFPSGWPEVHQPPARIRLDSAHARFFTNDTSFRRLDPDIAVIAEVRAMRSGAPPPVWQLRGRDSLSMLWTTGFAGVRVTVRLRTDSLPGTAHAFHDVIGPVQPTAPVLLRRAPCS